MSRKKWRKLILLSLLVAILGLSLVWLLVKNSSPSVLQLSFFDVGQGDAALIRTPAGQNILVDGGPGRAILSKLGQALPWAERTIDLMILSHPHADHLSGLIEVLKRYRVRRVLASGVLHTSPEYLEWLKLVRDKKIPLTVAHLGQVWQFSGGLSLQVLWPEGDLIGQTVKDLNATSIVLLLRYGETAALFTGDINQAEEERILKLGGSPGAQIIKVAHQGSRTSSAPAFIRAVAPELAVISVGRDNSYGHPHPEVLRLVENLVPEIWRTDQQGDLRLISDGRTWQKRQLLPFLSYMLP